MIRAPGQRTCFKCDLRGNFQLLCSRSVHCCSSVMLGPPSRKQNEETVSTLSQLFNPTQAPWPSYSRSSSGRRLGCIALCSYRAARAAFRKSCCVCSSTILSARLSDFPVTTASMARIARRYFRLRSVHSGQGIGVEIRQTSSTK